MFSLRFTQTRTQHLMSIAVAIAFATSVLFGGVARAASVPKTCPAASSIQKAAGTTLKRTSAETSKAALLCSYQAAKFGNVVITAGPLPGVSASAFAEVVQLEAKKAHLTKISGIGQLAYEFTQNNAKSNASGVATTGVFTLVGSEEFDVVGTLPAKNIVAIVKALVG